MRTVHRTRLTLALATALAASAQAQVNTDWVNPPDGVGIALNAAGEVYTARWAFEPGGDLYVSKRSPAGALLWEASSANTDPNRHEVATAIATDSRGRVLVSGTVRSGFSNPVDVHGTVLKFSPNGQLLWRRELSQAFDGSSTRRLLVDAADNVYVLGLGVGPLGLVSQVTRLTPDGVPVWTWSDSDGIGLPVQLKWGADGSLIVTGRGITGSRNGVVRIDTAGQRLWGRVGGVSQSSGDAATDAQGQTYVVDGGDTVLKLAADGSTLWSRPAVIGATQVAVGPDAWPVLAGAPSPGLAGAAFAKFNAAGELLWSQPDGDGPMLAMLMHAPMRLDAYGAAYLPGSTLSSMAVTKVRADGSLAWTVTTPGGHADALAIGRDLAVHAVGGQVARFSQVLADLGVGLSSSPDPARVGQPLQVQLNARNRGPQGASQVATRYQLPAGATLVSHGSSQGSCEVSGNELLCALGALAAGGQASVQITLQPQVTGKLRHRASIASELEDPGLADNSAQRRTRVR